MPGAVQPPTFPRQAALAATLFVSSYAFLAPGLTATLFSLKADIRFMGAAMPVLNLSKSTIGTILHLYDGSHLLPAGLIFVFSVLIPFLKLAVLLLAASRKGSDSEHLVRGLRGVSKWAAVDAFCIMTFAAAFGGMPAGAFSVDLQLHRGFYCFLVYCILSVAAVVSLPSASGELTKTGRLSALPQSPILLGVLFAFMGVLKLPLISFEVSRLGYHRRLCMADMIGYLAEAGLLVPAAAMICFVVLIPGLQMLTSLLQELNVAPRWAAEWLGHFAMFDVLTMSIAVTAMASSGLSSQLHVEVLGGARLLMGMILLFPFVKHYALAYASAAGSRCLKHADFVEEL